MKKYKRIVFVFRLSAIGDVIIALRAVELLVLNGYYPIFVTSRAHKEIIEILSHNQSIIIYEKGAQTEFFCEKKPTPLEEFSNFIKSIPVESPPLYLDLQSTSRSKRAINELKKYFKYEKIFKTPKKIFYRLFLIFISYLFFNQRKLTKQIDYKSIETIKNLQEKSVRKIVQFDKNLFVPLEINQTFSLLQKNLEFNSKSYVCLFPGASGFIKMWPKENFRELMNLILEKTNYNIVLCGSHSEIEIGDFLDFPLNERVQNLIHKTTMEQTLQYIANAKYIVTNDSFPAHAAQALNIPATVLFGATSPKFGFAPIADNIKIEYLNLACSPCTRHGKSSCRYENLLCLTQISARKVFENLSGIIMKS